MGMVNLMNIKRPKNGREMKELIESLKTDKGGYNKETLAFLGAWPPKKGWKQQLINEANQSYLQGQLENFEKEKEEKRENLMIEIKKNSQEIIRVESTEYKGNKFIDCRVYFLDKETGEYRPTKKGISFNHGVAKEVIEALLEVMEEDSWDSFETN